MALPISLYSWSNLGTFKVLLLAFTIVAISGMYTCRNYGEKWKTTMDIKQHYENKYQREKVEKLLILREAGYSQKS